jgi:hypothetical protein
MDECDAWGVKFGILEYKFHRNNSFKWAGGLSDVRGSSTVLPVDACQSCGVRLSFKIHHYGQEDGFRFLNCGHGGSLHTYHPKPNLGDLPFMKRHWSLAMQNLIKDGKTTSTRSSSLRYLVLKNRNVFLQKATLRSIQMVPDCLVAGDPTTTGQPNASQLVNWLRA